MRLVVLKHLATALIFPLAHAYSYLYIRDKSAGRPSFLARTTYDELGPKPCLRLEHKKTGAVTGLKIWTRSSRSRPPWAFLFFAKSQVCDFTGNKPVLVVYFSNYSSYAERYPNTFQLVDFEPLRRIYPDSIWKYTSWKEIQPGTEEWETYIEKLGLVPSQIAFDNSSKTGGHLVPIDPELTRVKTWYIPSDIFDEPLLVLRNDLLMQQQLGPELGMDPFGRNLGGAGYIGTQPAVEKWASIFGVEDIDPADLPNSDTELEDYDYEFNDDGRVSHDEGLKSEYDTKSEALVGAHIENSWPQRISRSGEPSSVELEMNENNAGYTVKNELKMEAEQESGFRTKIEEEAPQFLVKTENNLPNGIENTLPGLKFEPLSLRPIPDFGNIDSSIFKGLSESLQRQYAVANMGIEEVRSGGWDWGNPVEMQSIAQELSYPRELREHVAEKRKDFFGSRMYERAVRQGQHRSFQFPGNTAKHGAVQDEVFDALEYVSNARKDQELDDDFADILALAKATANNRDPDSGKKNKRKNKKLKSE